MKAHWQIEISTYSHRYHRELGPRRAFTQDGAHLGARQSKKKRLESKKPKLVVNNPENDSRGDLAPTPVFAQAADRLPSPSRQEVLVCDRPPPPHKPAEPSLTRMSDEIVSLRASVNKLARAQTALLSNVKALSDEVR